MKGTTMNPKKEELRPDMRGAMTNEEDPRERARRRVAELRQHLGSLDDGTDEFAAPEAPAGWTYEWKRKSVMGQEDPAYQVHIARQGWEAVPASRHPEMMPFNGTHTTIERKGMALMERPTELVEETRSIDLREARSQVRGQQEKIAGAPDGTLPRNDPRVAPKIKRGYEPMPVPED